jgi:hypothetical protein
MALRSPEAAWPALRAFLDRGGQPRRPSAASPSRAAVYRDEGGWHIRPESVRFIRALGIDQYQRTPASDGLEFHTDPVVGLEPFAWKQAWSPLIHLAGKDLYRRDGSAGLDRRAPRRARLGEQGRPAPGGGRSSAWIICMSRSRAGGGSWCPPS